MWEMKIKKINNQLEAMQKIRKPMPKPTKIEKTDKSKKQRFDWQKEIDNE